MWFGVGKSGGKLNPHRQVEELCVTIQIRLDYQGGRPTVRATTTTPVMAAAGNAHDFLWRNLRSDAERAALTVPFVAGSDGLAAWFEIVVRG